jgi:hypothetical protein
MCIFLNQISLKKTCLLHKENFKKILGTIAQMMYVNCNKTMNYIIIIKMKEPKFNMIYI